MVVSFQVKLVVAVVVMVVMSVGAIQVVVEEIRSFHLVSIVRPQHERQV